MTATAGFAKRLEQAFDAYFASPPLIDARPEWLANQMLDQFGERISAETALGWIQGSTAPTGDEYAQIAEVLRVDPTWLRSVS